MAAALDIRRRTFSLFFIVCFGHVLLISAQVQSKSGGPVAETAAFAVFARVQGGTSWAAGSLHNLWSRYLFLHGVAAENAAQRDEIARLQGQLQQEQAVASRTRGLESALGLRQSTAAPSLAAHVIAGDASPTALTVTIDRGAADGVESGMPVIAAQGVVGRVMGAPTAHASQVQLLIGRSAAAGALLERTNTGCVVEGGASNPPLRLDYVESAVDVKPGDRVLTRGGDGIYPQGFFIGVVERADRAGGQYKDVTVRPAVDFSHLDVVLVLLDRADKTGGGS